jgi:hypothetical protein
VGTYTTGLAADDREVRRAEIASDLWEHQRDAEGEGTRHPVIGLSIISRVLRGIPADVLWRAKMEGPKMDIRIPFERLAGGLLLAMIVLMMITFAIDGYDTSADTFEGELRRLAALGSASDNGNAFFRIATGLALIGAAAGFYVTLRERSPVLATMASFGLMAAAVLELVASGLQMVFVQLANEYVAASAADQLALLTNARTVAITVQHTTGAAMFALLFSLYVLAILAGREKLVPRWMIGLPIMSAVIFGGALIAATAGASDTWEWIAVMGGVFIGVLWLLIAGLWLIFTPKQEVTAGGTLAASAA